MQRIVLKFWWTFPILLCVLMLGLMFLFTTVPSVIEMIALPVSWVILIVNKKWWQCLLSFGLSVIIVILLWIPLVMGAMSGPDGFGRQHRIPDGLEYYIPLDYESGQKVSIDSLDSNTYLQVRNSFQGGIYNEAPYQLTPRRLSLKWSSRKSLLSMKEIGKIIMQLG